MSITGSAHQTSTQTPAAASSTRRSRSPSLPAPCYLAAIAALDEKGTTELSTPGHPHTYNAETIAAVLSEWMGAKVNRTTVAMRLKQLARDGELRREEVPGAAFAHGPAYVYGLTTPLSKEVREAGEKELRKLAVRAVTSAQRRGVLSSDLVTPLPAVAASIRDAESGEELVRASVNIDPAVWLDTRLMARRAGKKRSQYVEDALRYYNERGGGGGRSTQPPTASARASAAAFLQQQRTTTAASA